MAEKLKKDKEGYLERLARLGIKKSLGLAALAAAGVLLAPPAAAAFLTNLAAIELVQAGTLPVVKDHLKKQRLRKQEQKH